MDETTNKLLADILDRLDDLNSRVNTLAETTAEYIGQQAEVTKMNIEWVDKASNDIHNLVMAVQEMQARIPSNTAERLQALEETA